MKLTFSWLFPTIAALLLLPMACVLAQEEQGVISNKDGVEGWKTNTQKRTIELSELMSGGPGKDGIPELNEPKFIAIGEASEWLSANEPVVSLNIDGEARAYPLQILIWHEIVNDEIKGRKVAVTFCPLCYTAIAFDRTLDGKIYSFGVSGMLRHSDMIMFDRETESWWQQFSGEAIVGDLTGKTLDQLPAQIVSFKQFSEAFPNGHVLSRETGHKRDYGRNPYVGYDNIDQKPFLFKGKSDKRLRPMEKVIAVEINKSFKAYPYSITRKERVVYDRLDSTEIVVFHSEGAASALDAAEIAASKEAGSTGVFIPHVDGQQLTFTYDDGEFVDRQTNSRWNIFGHAIDGKLKGKKLKQITSGDYFAFAWFVFRPETEIYDK